MKISNTLFYLISGTYLISVVAFADTLSFQGSTGVLSTPTALLPDKGVLRVQENNFMDAQQAKRFERVQNHMFSIGVSKYLEIGGRLADRVRAGEKFNPNGTINRAEDLSGNIKLKLPSLNSRLPDMAIGIHDFAGLATNFESQYVVASKKLKNTQFSLGYAFGDNSSFNGGFGNVQFDVNSRFSLLTEYDTENINVGANINVTPNSRFPISFQASHSLGDQVRDDTTLGLTVDIPLNGKKMVSNSVDKVTQRKKIHRSLDGSIDQRIKMLLRDLGNLGFENIKVGFRSNGEYILQVENRVYRHSQMDAVGLVLGMAHEYIEDTKNLEIILVNNGVAELLVKTRVGELSRFLNSQRKTSSAEFRKQLIVKMLKGADHQSNDIVWQYQLPVSAYPRLDVSLGPSVVSAIGTEWGVYDYSLAMQTNLKVNTWKGGNLLFSADTLLDTSRNFEDGKPYAGNRHESGIKQIAFQQYVKPIENLSVLSSLGQTTIDKVDYDALQVQAAMLLGEGRHRLSTNLASFNNRIDSKEDHLVALGGYQYALPEKDLSFDLTYGEYFDGEQGAKYRVTKHFGDTEITAFVKYIADDDVSGGLAVKLPLTPRRSYKNNTFLLSGDSAWSYNVSTTIADPANEGRNTLRPSYMREPLPANSLSKDYQDSNRLTPVYIKSHIDRLREAYFLLRMH